MAAIVDTSILYALVDAGDQAHGPSKSALAAEREALIVPQSVLPEACYLISTRLGAAAELGFMRGLLASDWRLEALNGADITRATDILERYIDADIGIVDASVVAVAERLNVRRIYTLDRRHFGIIRPANVPAFDLLP